MSLTGSHECRCGRICNSVREFEKLEVERDVLKAENLRLREALEHVVTYSNDPQVVRYAKVALSGAKEKAE